MKTVSVYYCGTMKQFMETVKIIHEVVFSQSSEQF